MTQSVKPKVLILGTFHMRPTTDMFSTKMDDLLSLKRQQEIIEVVERIKKYRPTKLALEVDTEKNEVVNKQYKQYRSGNLELEVNEVHQLGFRIAADSAHEQLHCIDWMRGAGTKGVGEIYEWARDNQPDLFESIFGWLNKTNGNNDGAYQSILDMYQHCNEPSAIKKHHTMNINIARIGEWDNYIGLEWLIWWYQRNLILFSNLARISTSSDDRVLLIIGAGHVQILSQFLNESEIFDLESGFTYLT